MKLMITALAVVLVPAPALAATCRIITYFSDATMTKGVGSWSNCPGQKGLQGKRTRHREIETVELTSPRPAPGSLPCEFLARGCSPIPSPR